MKRKLIVSPELEKVVRLLPPEIKKKIRIALVEILEDPLTGKALVEELQGLRSYKLGKIRIVYRAEQDGRISIIAIGPRRSIYEKLILEIRDK